VSQQEGLIKVQITDVESSRVTTISIDTTTRRIDQLEVQTGGSLPNEAIGLFLAEHIKDYRFDGANLGFLQEHRISVSEGDGSVYDRKIVMTWVSHRRQFQRICLLDRQGNVVYEAGNK
jgi:hypothetical protein